LGRCLAALASQTLAEDAEVIVVDDGSVDGDAVASAVAATPSARLLRQPTAGPAAARNAGVRAAKGSIICFTDDDCQPYPEWAERLVGAIGRGADAVGGRTQSAENRATARASEIVARAPARRLAHGAVTFAPSNNIACRAKVAAAIPFDERYPAAAGEDREWCARFHELGYFLAYEPAAVLLHYQRADVASFIRQQLRYGRGAFYFHTFGRDKRPVESPRFYLDLIRRGFRSGFSAGLLVITAQAATAAGFLFESAASAFHTGRGAPPAAGSDKRGRAGAVGRGGIAPAVDGSRERSPARHPRRPPTRSDAGRNGCDP
jgi:glycosyltransferase involved in cell wall biosynthesis